MLRKLVCSILGHSINRNRVWHDGVDFRTACRRCQAPMVRENDGWQRFNPKTHGEDRPRSRPETST